MFSTSMLKRYFVTVGRTSLVVHFRTLLLLRCVVWYCVHSVCIFVFTLRSPPSRNIHTRYAQRNSGQITD